ncbi:cyclophilin-like fold protein [Amycolatopsis sp. NBC_01307]|uniref:cyclophilin-like fold protein n=1 Tax=Amycolatopsis sp. NBC_01307 TaxID=2903561 RepID=UPI002E130F4C|nr:cyclophilin-like fold protein [Amycolatopsis sp. NBC_01307]
MTASAAPSTMSVPRRLGAFAFAVLAGLLLAACGASEPQPGAREQPGTPAKTSGSGAAAREGTAVRIRIGEQTVPVTVFDTPTGRALLDRLPLTLSFSDHNGAEKTSPLPQPLPMDGMPEGDDPQPADLGYYAPWNNLVLYYADVPYWNGIARIGHIDGDLSAIASHAGDFTATVEKAA